MAAYQFMGLCIPALLVLIPNLLAAAAVAVGAGLVGDAVAGVLGGLLAGLVVLVVGGGISTIPAAIMNEACRAGYSDLAWVSVAASVVTAFVVGYATYRATPTIMVGAQRTTELAMAKARAQRKQVHQGTRSGESRRGAPMPVPVGGDAGKGGLSGKTCDSVAPCTFDTQSAASFPQPRYVVRHRNNEQ